MASATSTPATGRQTRSSGSAARRSGVGTVADSPSGTSPTRLSRLQEKEELRHLNDRLANYIERVRKLESEKAAMLVLLEEKEEFNSVERGNTRRLYEVELKDARKSLDELANEKARLSLDYGRLSEDHRKLQTRNQKKEAELSTAVTHWRSLEAALNSKDAECANLLAENRRLDSDVADLHTQLENLEAVLADVKNQLNHEMLRRVDMENQVQTLREQLEFQKNMSEQEMHTMRTRHESRLVEVDSGRQREFESKLVEAMQQLRKEHEAQIQLYKEELERTFIDKLDNAQQAAVKNNDVALLRGEELAGTKLRIETLSAQLNQFQKENGDLQRRVQDLERVLDRERGAWQEKLTQREQEMLAMRTKMLSQLEDYENLLDVKLALDMEINAYRKMLEGEEQRLRLSPSPSQPASSSRTWMHGQRLRGKKRKHDGASGSSPAYKVSQHSTAHGPVTVSEVDLDGKFITLKNSSDVEQSLAGWVVRRTQAETPDISFQISPSCVLPGGQHLTIWAADAKLQANRGDLIMQNHKSWGPIRDVKVSLLDPSFEEMAERRVVCIQGRGQEESDLEFDEEFMAGSDIHNLGRQPKRKKKKCCSLS